MSEVVTAVLDGLVQRKAGQVRIDVDALGCDFLSVTARKFLRGPRGIGFLYVAKKWLETIEPAMIDFFGAPWTSRDAYTLRPDASSDLTASRR